MNVTEFYIQAIPIFLLFCENSCMSIMILVLSITVAIPSPLMVPLLLNKPSPASLSPSGLAPLSLINHSCIMSVGGRSGS